MIIRDDLKKWKFRAILHLDFEDGYTNHYQCNEEPRLTYVDSGPRGKYRRSKTPALKRQRKFFVDGIECPDIDAVLTMLNAEPVAQE